MGRVMIAPQTDHNGRMRRLTALLVVALAPATGCVWDGPPRDVRVVGANSEPSVLASADGPAGGTGESATAGSSSARPADGQASPGLEDRPGTFGVLDIPATVAVVGDSLTVAASEEVTEALSRVGVRAVIVDGRESRRMASGSGALPSGVAAIGGILEEHQPDLWVVALGTNDVGAGVGSDRFRADLRETLAAIPPDAPVVWVDVWIRDRHDEVIDANRLLRRELASRSAPTGVVDWFSSGSVDGVITGDGIHLTVEGERRFASEIADGVVAVAVSAG